MKRLFLLLLFTLAFVAITNAQQTSLLSKEVMNLNEIVKKNTKPSSDLIAVFSLDEKNRILNLNLSKGKPFPASKEKTLEMFCLMKGAIPAAIIASAYRISENDLGSIALLKSLVDENYKINVTITDSNKESISYEMSAKELMAQ